MSELSNIVRQRLASRETGLVHPDADTLTAYMERLLREPERNEVQEHLAHCGQCREVTALSLPEQPVAGEGALVAAPPSSGRRWRFWTPAFGLAASVASLVIIAAMIIELPKKSIQEARQNPVRQSASPASSSNTSPAATSAQPEAATLVGAQPVPPMTSGEESHPGLATRKPLAVSRSSTAASPATIAEMARNTPARLGDSTWVSGGPRQGYLNSQMFANADANAFSSGIAVSELPSAPPPRSLGDRAPNTPLLSNTIPLPAFADAPLQIEGNKAVRTFTGSSAPSSRFGVPFLTALGRDTKQLLQRRTSPAISASSFVGHTMGGSQFNPARDTGQSVEITAAAPLLEKDSAELDQSRAFSARAMANPGVPSRMEKAAAPQLAWKVAGGKLLKSRESGDWVEAFSTGEGIEFSVVRFHGPEVWAGGSNAALVHSRDGGFTWRRITLGSSARGTISSIEAEGMRVQVKSSSGQSWSSPDGGTTWTLQD
jgi:Photosynthesis system II assembly factor YCF48